MSVTITITGVANSAQTLANLAAAARVLVERPVAVGPTVSYGLYQEVRRGYMATALSRAQSVIPAVIGQAIVQGPAAMTQAVDKIARDIQASAQAVAPVRTGALRASIGVFQGNVSVGGGSRPSPRGGSLSRRSRLVGGRR